MPPKSPSPLAQTPLILLALAASGCAALSADSTGRHGDGQDYGACPSGTHLECLANGSREDVVCDATTLRCRSGDVSIEVRQPQLGALGRPMHPIARENHLTPGQNEETPTSELRPRADLLAEIQSLNAQAASMDDDAWLDQATLIYRRLLAEQFALPLITHMRTVIQSTRQQVLAPGVLSAHQLDVAHTLASQYQRLELQDERVRPLRNILGQIEGQGMSLTDCVAAFEGKHGVISLGLPATESCLRPYLALIPELRQLNDRDLIDPSWLNTLEDLVYQLTKRSGL